MFKSKAYYVIVRPQHKAETVVGPFASMAAADQHITAIASPYRSDVQTGRFAQTLGLEPITPARDLEIAQGKNI